MSEKGKHYEEYDGPEFTVGKYEFRPDNSQLHLHSEMPEADHFRLKGKGSLFRSQTDNFQELAQYAEDGDYPIFRYTYPTDESLKVYMARFGAPKLPEFGWTSPRNEHIIAFGHYAMDHMVTVEDLFV